MKIIRKSFITLINNFVSNITTSISLLSGINTSQTFETNITTQVILKSTIDLEII